MGQRPGVVPSSASVDEVGRTFVRGFGAPLPLPRGPGVTLHRAPRGVASPPHADCPPARCSLLPLSAGAPSLPQLPSHGGCCVFRMHLRRVRPSLRPFPDHCGWRPASGYHPGRGVSGELWWRRDQTSRKRCRKGWRNWGELGRLSWGTEVGKGWTGSNRGLGKFPSIGFRLPGISPVLPVVLPATSEQAQGRG